MDSTGERFIPQPEDLFEEISVEHRQRYHSLAELVRGKRVLDAGSGEGYGTYFLAESAAHAFGVDVSWEAIEHAGSCYRRQNLKFLPSSVDALPFQDATFDVVVTFEVIEHLEQPRQDAFLLEARRVLKESGVLVISTPNKAVYSDKSGQHNQFHRHEFHVQEFEQFLHRVFPLVSLFGQSWSLSSALQKTDSRRLLNIRLADPHTPPKYVIAVCGATESVDAADLSSVVLDQKQRLEGLLERILALQGEIASRNQWASTLAQDLEKAQKRVVELQQEVILRNSWAAALEADLAQAGSRVADLQGEVSSRNDWVRVLEADQARARARIADLQAEVFSRNDWIRNLQADLAGEHTRVCDLQSEVEEKNVWIADQEKQLETSRQRIVDLQREVEEKNAWALSLDRKIGDLEQNIVHLMNLNQSLEVELALIKQSDFYKIATRYWRWRDKLLPHGSRRRRLLKKVLHGLKGSRDVQSDPGGSQYSPAEGNVATARPGLEQQAERDMSGREDEQDPGPRYARLDFAGSEAPEVSIIIPVFNQWACTYRCLQSIHRTIAGLNCEILLADDGSQDATLRAGEWLTGVRILRDGKNRGFLRNCNWAAGQARGQYLYFLNNDTELQPNAIQSLIDLLDRDPSFGMAGSKLVFPDGRIQEAGGILWADASGWNFGRGRDASLPAFNYVKEVDYLSGASFMIRRSLWQQIGGFDDRYAPAYCEDSDLAFSVRRQGFKVGYQPQSVVIHYEGASHGTDVGNSVKAYQVRNTELLKEKWASVLANHYPNGTHVFHARDRSAGKKTILIVDHYVPHIDRDAGSRTMWSFLQAFLAMGMNVKFLGDNFFPHQPYTGILQQAGIEVLVGPWLADHWPEWLEENGQYFDYVLLSRPHIAPKYLKALRSHTRARILYYVHDLHYLREAHLARIQGDPASSERAEEARISEQRLMNHMDVLYSCSDSEAALLRELCPGKDVHYVPPYAVDVDPAWEFDPAKRSGILFVGGFAHPPNSDGVQWFVRAVWPAVHARLPEAVFSIAGADPPPEIRALESDSVRVLGFVSDSRLKQLYETARLVAVPLRYGAGVKGKTVEAMAYGVPVVSTIWGFEGMPGVREILAPEQCSDSLADGILRLYQDDGRLKEISKRARNYVAGHFTIENIRSAFAGVIEIPPIAE